MERNEPTFGDRVKEKISNNITIPIKFPKSVYSDFKQFAKDEANNSYWNAIEKLLWYYSENEGRNVIAFMFMDKIAQLEERLDKYEKKDSEPKTRLQKRKVGFGRKVEE